MMKLNNTTLQIVGKLLVKDKKLYNTLADALYIEFDLAVTLLYLTT